MVATPKEKKPKVNGRPKGYKTSAEHAEKNKENGKLGGRPRRNVIYQKRILKPGERVELPQPDMILEEIMLYIRIQGTEEEIASHYLMSVDTLNNRLKEHFGCGFSDIKKLCQASGKLGMRLIQYNQSKKNTNMAKHLGECWLGQKSTTKVEVTNMDAPVYMPLKRPVDES